MFGISKKNIPHSKIKASQKNSMLFTLHKYKKAIVQNVTAAPLLVVAIMLVILIYTLSLPPTERAELLGDSPTTVTVNGQAGANGPGYTGKTIIISEVPGNIDYTALNELEIPLNPFTLFKTVDATVLTQMNPFMVKNGIGDVQAKNMSFVILNLELVDNINLLFTPVQHDGILTIRVNGNDIYNYAINSEQEQSLKLDKNILNEKNTIEFVVSGVGWKFWQTNQYKIENIKIIGDVTDISRQESVNTFFISESQGSKIDGVKLQFNPECKTADVGRLTILLNDRQIYSGIPDCGSLNFVDIAPNLITIGKNKIMFNTDRGSYLVDLVKLKIEFKDNDIPIYYFDLETKLFALKYSADETAICGTIDGVCPKECDEDNDYDCCMTEYTTPFWCVAKTNNEDDQCVGFVTTENVNRCPTNYVGKSRDTSEVGEEKCGDNTDGDCPAGCSTDYDKDCCFDQTGDQFWCDFMPVNGLSFRCVDSVSLGQCEICPTGYDGEDSAPRCSPGTTVLESEELKSEYKVFLTMKFTDDYQRKKADIYVNGHLTRMDLPGTMYRRDISAFVEPGSNSIEVVPFSQLNIRTLEVEVLN